MRAYGNGIGASRGPSAWWRARRFWLSFVAVTAGFLVSAFAWAVVSHHENELAELELSSRANSHIMSLQSGIDAYMRKVFGLQALFESSDYVSREQFEKFTKQIMNDQNALLGMSWIPRVSPEQRAVHEARRSARWHPRLSDQDRGA
jgi:CHASE1-domain containing sensor protein